MARSVTKGKLGELTFQLNPTNMNYEGGAVWGSISSPGLSKPISSYSYGQDDVYSFELWYTDKHEHKLKSMTTHEAYKKLLEYRKGNKSLLFTFGNHLSRKVVIASCSITIEAWNHNLTVKEFRASISLRAE
jgi:hypothetical protein